MAITQSQVDAALVGSQKLRDAAIKLNTFAQSVQTIVSNNWLVSNIPGTVLSTTLSAADQTAITNQYAALKQSLVDIYATLP